MELFTYKGLVADPRFDYAIKFNRTMKTFRHFDDFMSIIGAANPVKFDLDNNCWLVSAYTFNRLSELDETLFPDKKKQHKKSMKARMQEAVKGEVKVVYDYDSMGADMKLQPYDYQKRVIKFAVDAETALIVSPCGSGKTPMGIGIYLEALKAKKIHGPGVIVVKASLKTQWAAEIRKFSDLTPKIIKTSKDVTRKIQGQIKRAEKKFDSAKNLAEQQKCAKGVLRLK